MLKRALLISALCSLVVIMGISVADAEWVADGVLVTQHSGNFPSGPQIISDGSGGAIIAWSDKRSSGYSHIYAQRVSAWGDTLWAVNGVALCTAANGQGAPQITSDGYGGAIVTWYDKRSGDYDIYAQRVNASGQVQWPASGIALCTAAGDQQAPRITVDESGGAIVTWMDKRSGNYDIYARRVSASGQVQWTADGVALCSAALDQIDPMLVSDGAGGAIVVWEDKRSGIYNDIDIYAQRVSASGQVQWTADGVALCTAASYQLAPQITTDDSGGAIITWEDARGGCGMSCLDIYAQRVNETGVVQWVVDGVAICTAENGQEAPQIALDGSGGAIITWEDDRYPYDEYPLDIYAQRVNESGQVQWTTDGILVSGRMNYFNLFSPQIMSDGSGGAIIMFYGVGTGDWFIWISRVDASGSHMYCILLGSANYPGISQMASDGSGGAIVTWWENTLSYYNTSPQDLYAQRVNASGIKQWGPDPPFDVLPVLICGTYGEQSVPQITSDGSGGAIITAGVRRSSSNYNIYAQRVSAFGDTLWTADGVYLCTAADYRGAPQITSDGYGGAIITWKDHRSGDYDIYAQRVNASGAVQWTADGVALCTAAGEQGVPQITSDGSGGAIITWPDHRANVWYPDIYAQRVNASGAVQWAANGISLCTAAGEQEVPQITSDGYGGAIITWKDYRSGDYDIYAQRVNASGAVQWTADGVALCKGAGDQEDPQITSDGSGGAIVTCVGIYAQRVNASGQVQWTGGKGVYLFGGHQPQISSDGSGGAIVTGVDGNTIRAQRVDANGAIPIGWAANGVALCTAAGEQGVPQITSDGSGGAIITWPDHRANVWYPDIYAQRVNANGQVLWTADGLTLCTASGEQEDPQITSDGSGGGIVTWADQRGSMQRSYAQWTGWTGACGPVCGVHPSQIDFPNAILVGSSRDTSFAITNEGRGTLIGQVSEACDEFRIISGGGSFDLTVWDSSLVVTVRFEPADHGTHSCTINLGQDLFCSDVSITGTAIGPICTVDPDSIAFTGSTQVGNTRDTTFTIKNEGGGVLAGDVSESCDHFGIVSGGGPFSLAHGQSQVVTVRFEPMDHGTHSCTINLGEDLCTDVSLTGKAWMCLPDSVLYVDADANGVGDGSSWEDAFTELRDALAFFYTCPNVTQIWVAEGTYKPTAGTERTASFNLQNEMAVYGGFAGSETSLSQRSVAEHTTVLSGDIGAVGTATDNCYHVVKINWTNYTWEAVLDGLTVMEGYANGSQNEEKKGGGIYIYATSAGPVIRNVTVWGNYATNWGGGMYCRSNAIVTDAVFEQNTSDYGGGVYLETSHATLTNVRVVNNTAEKGGGIYNTSYLVDKYINVLFYGNHATEYGGGFYYLTPSTSPTNKPQLTNVSFSRNSATLGGGGVWLEMKAKIVLTNSILWGDSSGTGNYPEIKVTAEATTTSYSIVQGCGGSGAGWNPAFGIDGGYNLDANPLFFNAPAGDLRLQVGSPGIDAGNNSVPGGLPATDLAGNPRIQNGIVDMGAYEGAIVPVQVTARTSPPGLNVAVDDSTFVSPRTFLSEAGLSHEIGVTTPQQRGDTLYSFTGWSDAGDTTHTVILPNTNVTYTASFAHLFNYAQIDSIVDVPGDQGGWVRVYFKRSHYDNPLETQYPVARYDIHRRVDNPGLASSILAKGEGVTEDLVATLPGGEKVQIAARSSAAGKKYLQYEERYYLVNEAPLAAAPPGLWEVVGNVSAQQQAQYIRLSPTLGDSTETIAWSVFYISAHTTTPSIFYDSPPDSGYSVDNLPPGVPQGFEVAYNTGSGNHLSWDPCGDRDFQYFKIYRGTAPGFVPAPENLVHSTAQTSWSDPEYDGWKVYYKVAAVDHAGNESGPASPEATTDAGGAEIPKAFALYQNVPNPFNPTTVIRYDVPSGGGKVTLKVYDVSGRIVQTLVDAVQSAGQKTARWEGRNERGERVATGIYFYRMEAPGFVEMRKMVLLR